jgi:hypothetical protein
VSSNYPAPVSPKWLKPGPRWGEILIISELRSWVSHWDNRISRTRQCGGPGCRLCAMGYQKQLRVVLMGIDASTRDVLFELRERHRAVLDPYPSTVGLVVKIRKTGTAKNSPVEIQVIGNRNAAERDISKLVAVLGEEALFVEDDRAALDRMVDPIVEQLKDLDLERNRVENPAGYEDFE